MFVIMAYADWVTWKIVVKMHLLSSIFLRNHNTTLTFIAVRSTLIAVTYSFQRTSNGDSETLPHAVREGLVLGQSESGQ